MIEMSEIDLNKVSGAEWDKYAKMSSIARNGRAVSTINIVMTAIGLILFLYFAFLAFMTFPLLHSADLSLNYTSAVVKAMALNFTTKSGIAAGISSLSHNSTALVAVVFNHFEIDAQLAYTLGIVFLLGTGYVFFLLFGYLGEAFCKKDYRFRSLRSVRNALGYNEQMKQRLQQYGYTKDEIRWYFDMREKLAEFKAFINGSGL